MKGQSGSDTPLGVPHVHGATPLLTLCLAGLMVSTGTSTGAEEPPAVQISAWAQGWYQHLGDAGPGTASHDFMLRRVYVGLEGRRSERLSFFTHLAVDRLGQQGLDQPGSGLGSGLAVRDAWVRYDFHDALRVQMGRMYVPLTRSYGTTSTRYLLTGDLPFLQGGIRGSIFYAGKVGRDDGVVLWGPLASGRLQYRLMVAEGVEGADNPDDRLRFAGRVSLYLRGLEEGWFNKGTYLGTRNVLALGAGFDAQQDLLLAGGRRRDHRAWTADLFAEQRLAGGAVTAEASVTRLHNATQTHALAALSPGDDTTFWYVQAGYVGGAAIGPFRVQPFGRYETAVVDDGADTGFYGGGVNLYHDSGARLTVDVSYVDASGPEDPVRRDHAITTVQWTVGF